MTASPTAASLAAAQGPSPDAAAGTKARTTAGTALGSAMTATLTATLGASSGEGGPDQAGRQAPGAGRDGQDPANPPAEGTPLGDRPIGQIPIGHAPIGRTIDIAGIMQAIPHRYPFLLLDRVVELVPDVSAIGVKNVSVNEGFFQGHFPNHPVMPGVLIIESMAQTAAVLVVETLGSDAAGRVVYFMSVDGAKFRRPVVPGDQLRIHCRKERHRGMVWKFHAIARVDGVAVAEATYTAMIMDRAEPTRSPRP